MKADSEASLVGTVLTGPIINTLKSAQILTKDPHRNQIP
jgi:hypothetical protein